MNNLISLCLFIFLCSCAEQLPKLEKSSAVESLTATETTKKVSYKYLSGLKHLYVLYHPILNKRVYLIGEKHTSEGRCPQEIQSTNVIDFIYTIPKQSTKFIDLFLETTPSLNATKAAKTVKAGQEITKTLRGIKDIDDLPHLGGYLGETNQKLKSCYGPSHRCPFPNMRVHWTDLRLYSILNKDLKPTYQISFFNLYAYLRGYENALQVSLNLENISTKEGLIKFIKRHVESGKIKKQWQNLPKEYFAKLMEHVESENYDFYPLEIMLLGNQKTILRKDSVEAFVDQLNRTIFPLTDAYALGRFLRDFKEKPNSPFPSRVENAIFFFGAAHTASMKKYLQSIDFIVEQSFEKTLLQHGKSFDLCLSVEGLIEPFSQNDN